MKSKQVIGQGGLRIWIAVLDSGDEAKSALENFARAHGVESASFVAIGAFERATLGYFDWTEKRYVPIPVDRQTEVLSFIGDVVRDEKGAVSLHAHTVLGLPGGETRGGHFLSGTVRPTLEVTFTETPSHLVRRKRDDLGIALIDLD